MYTSHKCDNFRDIGGPLFRWHFLHSNLYPARPPEKHKFFRKRFSPQNWVFDFRKRIIKHFISEKKEEKEAKSRRISITELIIIITAFTSFFSAEVII